MGWLKALSLLVSVFLLSAVSLLTTVSQGHADWINLSGAETAPNIAEIRILDDRVNVRLEIFVGELKTFADIIPDDLLNKPIEGRPGEAERLKRFSEKIFSVRDANGSFLLAVPKLVEPRMRVDRRSPFAGMINPQTGRPTPQAPADKRVLFAELDYPFDGQPESLTIVPPRDENGNTIATIGFIAYHKSVPIIDFRYLSRATDLRLDWDDPWYTRFDDPNLKRHHQNPLMSFLYVEPRRIRHEVLMRVRDLQEWTDLGIAGQQVIPVDRQDHIGERAIDFIKTRLPLQIDGLSAEPVAWRSAFLNLSINGIQIIEEPADLDMSTAVVGISLTYPIDSLPQSATVSWDLFNDRIERVPSTTIDPAGPFLTFVEPDFPKIEWTNFLKKYTYPVAISVSVGRELTVTFPLLSVILIVAAIGAVVLVFRARGVSRRISIFAAVICIAGAVFCRQMALIDIRNPFAPLPDETASARIINAVLDSVHSAYLQVLDEKLDRDLETVVSLDSFAETKAELTRAVAIKIAGGGTASVHTVEDLTVQEISARENGNGFRALAEWTGLASGGHWGHMHRRRIRFRAILEMGELDGNWKLTGITVLDAQQEA